MLVIKNNTPSFGILSINESSKASSILKNYLKKITTNDFQITNTIISSNNFIFSLDVTLKAQGFKYEMDESNIYFFAQTSQSFVYCIYDFLENVLGCRYYSSDFEFIPKLDSLTFDFQSYSYTPTIDYREVEYQDFTNYSFAEKLKLTQSQTHDGWGFWSHSFSKLLPENLFIKHPEYFALIDGERNIKGEPCLSNLNVRL